MKHGEALCTLSSLELLATASKNLIERWANEQVARIAVQQFKCGDCVLCKGNLSAPVGGKAADPKNQ